MGVEDLTELAGDPEGLTEGLEEFQGKKIAWDLSGTLHKALGSRDGADQLYAEPPVPITAMYKQLDDVVAMFEPHKITLIAVIDGVDNPRKLATNARKAENTAVKKKIEAFWKRGAPADMNDLQKIKKKAGRVRPDMLADAVKYLKDKHNIGSIGAPYEAEWQCVELLNRRVVVAIYSNDSDNLPLGSPATINKIKWVVIVTRDGAGEVVSKQRVVRCSILRRNEAITRLKSNLELGSLRDDSLLALCAFLGNDYIYRLKGNGPKACAKLLKEWQPKSRQDRKSLLTSLNSTKERKRFWNKGGGVVTQYEDKFNIAVNLFKYCPVIREDTRRGTFSMVPLNPLPPGAVWKNLIGFDPVVTFNKAGVSLGDTYHMTESCRYGKGNMKPLPLPKHPTDSSRTVPHGAVRDFDKVPPELTPQPQLLEWLWFRRVSMTKAAKVADLVRAVTALLEQQPPRQIRDSSSAPTGSNWVSWEQIAPEGDGPLDWSVPGDVLSFFREELRQIDAYYIDSIYGKRRNGVRMRAYLRYISGHYNITSLRMATACLVDTGETVTVVEITCTPSMKSEEYCVRLIFDGEGDFMRDPSQCECPDGCFFCSHMLGVFLIIRAVQQKKDWTIPDVASAMHEPIKTIQSLPISVDHVYKEIAGDEAKASKELKAFGKALAKEHPGYAAGDDDDEVADEEVESQSRSEPDIGKKSLDICGMLDAELAAAVKRAEVRGAGAKAAAKYSSSAVHEHNRRRVHCHPLNQATAAAPQNDPASKQRRLVQAERHEAFHRLHELKALPDSLMMGYVGFAENRSKRRRLLEDSNSGWHGKGEAEIRGRFRVP